VWGKKISLGHRTRKNAQFKLYKTMALPCLMYGSEMLTQKNRRKTIGSRYVTGYTVWDKERSGDVRSQLGMRKLDK
jgi:hypothetical protein